AARDPGPGCEAGIRESGSPRRVDVGERRVDPLRPREQGGAPGAEDGDAGRVVRPRERGNVDLAGADERLERRPACGVYRCATSIAAIEFSASPTMTLCHERSRKSTNSSARWPALNVAYAAAAVVVGWSGRALEAARVLHVEDRVQ